ncbi:MAG: DEAD/DEAH box helicase [Opitutaceae bacterium]|nr:DEAD/DEAH box helicase [Opitutaceae bacterium]
MAAEAINQERAVMQRYGARRYQAEAVVSVGAGFAEDPEIKAQLVCAATGTGKTIIFSVLAKIEEAKGGRTLILAHTDELIDQAIDKLFRSTGLKAAKEKAQHYAGRWAKIVVGSVQTLHRTLRLTSWPKNHFTLIIVDEAHRSLAESYQTILQHFMAGGAKVVGVTATPDRGDKRALGEFYQRIAYDYGLRQACRDGWLVRPIVKTMPLSIDLNGVKTKKTADGNDLDRMEVGRRLVPFLGAIAENIKKEAGAKKVLIFMPSVETAQMMADALRAAGVSADWVCGDKKLCPDRTERVERHKAGRFQALVNMAILTEGYDDDSIEIIVCLRATKIRSLYAQIIGRGTRPMGNIVKQLNQASNALERQAIIAASDKPVVTILDFLWLYEKHDLCRPASLVAKDAAVEEQMEESSPAAGDVIDLLEAEERAERDLLQKLEEDLKKNQNKRSEVVDPLAVAADLADIELANYEAMTKRDARPATTEQLRKLLANGVDASKIKNYGHARATLDKIVRRHEAGLCNIRQLNFFTKLGVDASQMSQDEAFARMAEWESKQRTREVSA